MYSLYERKGIKTVFVLERKMKKKTPKKKTAAVRIEPGTLTLLASPHILCATATYIFISVLISYISVDIESLYWMCLLEKILTNHSVCNNQLYLIYKLHACMYLEWNTELGLQWTKIYYT